MPAGVPGRTLAWSLRPLVMWLGQDLLGRPLGILAGKFVHIAFYAPVIVTYEVRNRAHGRW